MSKTSEARIQEEIARFNTDVNVHDLPEIFHYWSHTYLRPMLAEYDITHPDDLFANHMLKSAVNCQHTTAQFLSIGAGNCDTEIRVAALLKSKGLEKFNIECLELNPQMLKRAKQDAKAQGLAKHLSFTEADFNLWTADKQYSAIMANQSLHHVEQLEHLYDQISLGLTEQGVFITSDMIGRNGHQRWSEALTEVHRFWHQLPEKYRYNHQLQRYEELYENWDCSNEGFEGIRAQDVLPLLLKRFHFQLFIGYSNIIDVFIDRGFGHNFDRENPEDRAFIDKVHAFDEEQILAGYLTPTHMMAVMGKTEVEFPKYSRFLSPDGSVRYPLD